MGCQKSIARKIVGKKADYILSVKENQKDLYEDIQDSFRILTKSDYFEDLDYGLGRIEKRKCSIITDLSLLENAAKWKGLISIIKIDRERYFKGISKNHFFILKTVKLFMSDFDFQLLIHYSIDIQYFDFHLCLFLDMPIPLKH